MQFTVIIPARYASSRLPAKPLSDIDGKPMIQWVYEAAKRSEAQRVVVASDDERIADVVADFSGECLITSVQHQSGTDRLQEAARLLGLTEEDIVVNVQGDEPLIPAEVINQVAANLAHTNWASLATLCEPLETIEDCNNPNIVKVVCDDSGRALYFSRAAIPFKRDANLVDEHLGHRHVGLYAYRVSFLNKFVEWPEHVLESTEKLEQLRALANGAAIHVANSVMPIPIGVDTAEDLIAVRTLLADK